MADGSVIIDTKLDDSGFKKGISGFSKLGNVAGKALKGVAIATGTVTTALAGMITASVKATGEIEQQIGGTEAVFKEYAKEVQKSADEAYSNMGLSANDYMATINKMGSLMQGSGIDIKTSMDLSSQAMQRAADVASIMGIDINSAMESIAGAAKGNFTMMDNLGVAMNATTLEAYALEKGIKKSYTAMSNSEKIQLSMQMFLEKSTYAMGNYRKENETFAGSLTTLKASFDNFMSGAGSIDALVDSVMNFATILIKSIEEVAPRIIGSIANAMPEMLKLGVNLIRSLIQGIMDNKDVLMEAILETVSLILQTLLEMLPEILKIGIEIIAQLIQGIAEQLPELIPTAVDCIILLVETLIDNIDLLVDAGIELIIALAEGLIEALPRLIEKAPVIIEKLVNALIRNFPKIIKAGGELLGKLITGIVGSFFKLLEVAPQIIANIVNGIKRGWEEIKNVGRYLIEGLWNGIAGMANWVYQKVVGFANNIVANIKKALGIHSPSRVFRDEIGKNLGLGLGEGFENSLSGVYKSMQRAVDYENAKLSSNLTTTHLMQLTNEDNRQARLESIDNNKEIQVNSTLNLDGKVVANTVNRVNARQKLQYGIA